jgi:hypothetical protein
MGPDVQTVETSHLVRIVDTSSLMEEAQSTMDTSADDWTVEQLTKAAVKALEIDRELLVMDTSDE